MLGATGAKDVMAGNPGVTSWVSTCSRENAAAVSPIDGGRTSSKRPRRLTSPGATPRSHQLIVRCRKRRNRPARVCRVTSSAGTAEPVRMNRPGLGDASTARRTRFHNSGAHSGQGQSCRGLRGRVAEWAPRHSLGSMADPALTWILIGSTSCSSRPWWRTLWGMPRPPARRHTESASTASRSIRGPGCPLANRVGQ